MQQLLFDIKVEFHTQKSISCNIIHSDLKVPESTDMRALQRTQSNEQRTLLKSKMLLQGKTAA